MQVKGPARLLIHCCALPAKPPLLFAPSIITLLKGRFLAAAAAAQDKRNISFCQCHCFLQYLRYHRQGKLGCHSSALAADGLPMGLILRANKDLPAVLHATPAAAQAAACLMIYNCYLNPKP